MLVGLSEDVRRSRLISDEYRSLQTQLHEDPNYGVASIAAAPMVSRLCNLYEVEELLDYGAGKGNLAKHLDVDHPMRVQMYDPAIEEWSEDPEPSQMVACVDVLEHIEPQLLENVLDDLQRVTQQIGFYSVSTGPAMKTLADGRNAHLIIKPLDWWLPKICERWDLHTFQRTQDGFFVLVMAKEIRR